MEFGVVDLDNHGGRQKGYGSTGFLKQDRSRISDYDSRASKIPNLSDDLPFSKTRFVLSDGHQEQNMLSFSSPKLEDFSLKCNNGGSGNKNLQSPLFPYSQCPSSSNYSKISGYSCTGNLNASMYLLNGVKAVFTPSQWLELEQQALIYKYIIADEPIPSTLLNPIRRALESAGFSSFPGGILRPSPFGWVPFHLGLSNSTDPEPGRCRRTDGKKWRCSRDAVPDQKYCERHINRGRHRSRKPVEGHSGSRTTTNKTTTTNLMNIAPPSSSLVVRGGDTSNSFSITHNQSKDLMPVASDYQPSLFDRHMVNKANSSREMQDERRLDFLSPSISLNSNGNLESNPGCFAALSSYALLNNPTRSSYLDAQEPDPQHSLRSFMDEWPPKNPVERSSILSDNTKLSISIPMAPFDFMSSTSSPTGENVRPPLRLSRELDSVQMGLGVGMVPNGESHKQPNWVPIPWETSMGGPLGEALKSTSNSSGDNCKKVSALDLLPNPLTSSPTNVLQRTAFGSVSNSSAGSSPRAENRKALQSGDFVAV